MKEIATYSGCFVCGDKNEIGLNVKFHFEEEKAITEYTAEKRFEGYAGIFHGGIISTLLDEVMIKALLAMEIHALTVELTVRFKKAVHTGDELFLTGYLESKKGRLFQTRGEVKNSDGELVAFATGKYLQVKENMKAELMKSLEK